MVEQQEQGPCVLLFLAIILGVLGFVFNVLFLMGVGGFLFILGICLLIQAANKPKTTETQLISQPAQQTIAQPAPQTTPQLAPQPVPQPAPQPAPQLQMEQKYCPHCGAKTTGKYCTECGSEID